MPLTGTTFSYTNPSGATSAAAGQVVQSAVWNQIHTDISNAITQAYSQGVSMLTLRNLMADNGGFEVWQRGAGNSASIAIAASTLAYTADRWYIQTGTNQAFTISAQTGLSGASSLCAQVQRNSGQTGTGAIVFAYPFDTPEIVRMHGKKLTFQMLAATGANWSPTSGTFTCTLYYGTGAVAKRNATPYTGEAQGFAITTNLTAGSSATVVTGTTSAAIPTTTTQMELQISWTPVGTAGANDWIQFDDVQLEIQNSTSTWAATSYDRIPQQIELLLCQRHYQKTYDYSVAPGTNVTTFVNCLSAISVATQRFGVFWDYPVTLRANPTLTTWNPISVTSPNWEMVSLGVDANTSVALIVGATSASNGPSTKGVFIYTTTSGGTSNQFGCIHAAVDAGI